MENQQSNKDPKQVPSPSSEKTFTGARVWHLFAFMGVMAVVGMVIDRALLSSPYFWSIFVGGFAIILLTLKDKIRARWAHDGIYSVWIIPGILIGLFVLAIWILTILP